VILLVEKSMFQWKKKRKKREHDSDESKESTSEIEVDESDEEEVGVDSSKMEYGKKVKPELQWWTECKSCQHDVADKYFNNPPDHKHE
jgi:hypothetical protein